MTMMSFGLTMLKARQILSRGSLVCFQTGFLRRVLTHTSCIKLQQVQKTMDSRSVTEESLVEEHKWSMAALLEQGEDVSLETEAVHLQSCEDEEFKRNAYKWCSRYLSGTWARIPFEKINVQYIRFV